MHKTTRKAKNISGGKDFNITTETSVSKSLDIHSKSKIGGRDAFSVVYNSRSADALAAYSLIHKDLKFCKTTLNLAVELAGGDLNSADSLYLRDEVDKNSDILKALTVSFIITYGKCYTQADGRKVKLDSKDIFKNNSELKEIHEFLMHERNNYIAHAGNTDLETAKTLILLDADQSRGEVPKLMTQSNDLYAFEESGLKPFIKLVDFVEEKLCLLLQKRVQKIKDNELKKVSDSYLYELARNGKSLDIET